LRLLTVWMSDESCYHKSLVSNLACTSCLTIDGLGNGDTSQASLVAQFHANILTWLNSNDCRGAVLTNRHAFGLSINESTWLKDETRILREADLSQTNLPIGATCELTGHWGAVGLDNNFVIRSWHCCWIVQICRD